MALQTVQYKGDFINGAWIVPDRPDGSFLKKSPGDFNDLILDVEFRYDHIVLACKEAQQAFKKWSRLSQSDRSTSLLKLRDVFDLKKSEMAQILSRDTGRPLWETTQEVLSLVSKIQGTVEDSLPLIAQKTLDVTSESGGHVKGQIHYCPRGVMAVVGTFSLPAFTAINQIVPALIAGNTVVFKPSEHTPATGQFLAECFEKSGFLPGVFNLVQSDVNGGKKLVTDENVNGILFAGSYETGLSIKHETLSHYWKVLALEMGGKNASLVWQDANLDKAIYKTLLGAYLSSGQRGTSTSRILVHESIYEVFLERFYQHAKKLSVGHWNSGVFMGPLISEGAVEKYLRFQEISKREGCESYMRGKVIECSHKGFYVTPSITLVKEVKADSIYQKSEILGPNVAVYKVSDVSQSMEIINSTGYGLSLALFTEKQEVFCDVIQTARVGAINCNGSTHEICGQMPLAPQGKSSNDRYGALYSVLNSTFPKTCVQDNNPIDLDKIPPGLFFETEKSSL